MSDYSAIESNVTVLRAEYGKTIEQAIHQAMKDREEDATLVSQLGLERRLYVFSYHGLRFPLEAWTSESDLAEEVRKTLVIRALAYQSAPVPETCHERVQSPSAGDQLSRFVVQAMQCAQFWGNSRYEHGLPAFAALRHALEFNGVKVYFNPWYEQDEPQRIEAAVKEGLKKKHEEYLASDAYKEQQAQSERERQALQDKVPGLMAQLPEILAQDMLTVMNWVVQFSNCYDRSGVITEPDAVVNAFTAAGFSNEAYVGEQFKDIIENDVEAYGKYVIGQFLSILPMRCGMPNILWYSAEKFTERWNAKVLKG